MTIAAKMLAEFDEEFASTRKLLALIPDEKLLWKPHQKSMELGKLAWHLADFPEWFRDTLKRDVMSFSEEDGAKMMRAWEGKTRADLLDRFDSNVAEARELLASTSDEEMARHWKMQWNGELVIDSPREQVLRKWVMNHMIHHRAQLGMYLRLNEVPIPGMYGPSADEMVGQGSAASG